MPHSVSTANSNSGENIKKSIVCFSALLGLSAGVTPFAALLSMGFYGKQNSQMLISPDVINAPIVAHGTEITGVSGAVVGYCLVKAFQVLVNDHVPKILDGKSVALSVAFATLGIVSANNVVGDLTEKYNSQASQRAEFKALPVIDPQTVIDADTKVTEIKPCDIIRKSPEQYIRFDGKYIFKSPLDGKDYQLVCE